MLTESISLQMLKCHVINDLCNVLLWKINVSKFTCRVVIKLWVPLYMCKVNFKLSGTTTCWLDFSSEIDVGYQSIYIV